MKDRFGEEVVVGDKVVFAVESFTCIEKGKIIEFIHTPRRMRIEYNKGSYGVESYVDTIEKYSHQVCKLN